MPRDGLGTVNRRTGPAIGGWLIARAIEYPLNWADILAESAGQGGERRGKPFPEVAGVRVRATIEEQPGGGQTGRFGYAQIVRETGTAQPEAIRLYERAGYVRIPGLGPYADDPRSVCFARRLPRPLQAT